MVYLRIAIHGVVSRNRESRRNVAVELASTGDIRDKNDLFLAGIGPVNSFEIIVRRNSQDAEALLPRSPTLGALEKMA